MLATDTRNREGLAVKEASSAGLGRGSDGTGSHTRELREQAATEEK